MEIGLNEIGTHRGIKVYQDSNMEPRSILMGSTGVSNLEAGVITVPTEIWEQGLREIANAPYVEPEPVDYSKRIFQYIIVSDVEEKEYKEIIDKLLDTQNA